MMSALIGKTFLQYLDMKLARKHSGVARKHSGPDCCFASENNNRDSNYFSVEHTINFCFDSVLYASSKSGFKM